MSDERLREAERKWKESGSVADEARYLLERVRVGDLTRERLELAAYCGHEGAAVATGAPPPPSACSTWANGLAAFGRAVLVRAAAEAAAHALVVWSAKFPYDPRPSDAVEVARASLTEKVAGAFDAFDDCLDAGAEARALGFTQAEAAAEAAGWAALAAHEETHPGRVVEVVGLTLEATQVALGAGEWPVRRQVVEVAQWALGNQQQESP